MRSEIRIIGVVAGTLAVVVGSASIASAQSATIKDKRHDVYVGSSVHGSRTAAEKSFARAFDVKSEKFSIGGTNVSYKVTFADLRPDASYSIAVDIEKRFRPGFSGLEAHVTPQGVSALSTSTLASNYTCGDPQQPGVPAGVPPITTDVKYGKNGYIRLQLPYGCIEKFGRSPRARVHGRLVAFKAKATVQASTPISARGFTEPISSTKVSRAKWTKYVKAG